MKIIFNIFILLLFIFAFSCSHIVMLNSYDDYVNSHQMDSLCSIESIPYPDNSKWIVAEFPNEGDGGNKLYQYTYIKSYMDKYNAEIIYIVTPKNDSIYKFTKRTTKQVKK